MATNNITFNITIASAITQNQISGDVLFRLNGSTEDTGFKYDTAASAILFLISGTEVGRMSQ